MPAEHGSSVPRIFLSGGDFKCGLESLPGGRAFGKLHIRRLYSAQPNSVDSVILAPQERKRSVNSARRFAI